MYANGKGVQQDYPKAKEWWTKAGAGGHALAAESAKRNAPRNTGVTTPSGWALSQPSPQ